MTTILVAPREHWGWLFERANFLPCGDFQAIEAVDDKGEIEGMVGYEECTLSSCRMHVAVERPSRRLLRTAFAVPFKHGGKTVVWGVISACRPKALRLALKLGFVEKARLADACSPGCARVVVEMRAENCQWLRR